MSERARGERRRRRYLLGAILRPLLLVAGYLTVYFTAPLNRPFTGATAFTLSGLVLALGALIAWQAHRIAGSEYPRLRAAEALGTSVPLFLVLFATAYYMMAGSETGSFSVPLTRIDSLYFSVTVFSTVGFGDIAARSEAARCLVMGQMLGDVVIVGLVARVLVDAVRKGLDRQNREAGDL